jgi:hypothetical protein
MINSVTKPTTTLKKRKEKEKGKEKEKEKKGLFFHARGRVEQMTIISSPQVQTPNTSTFSPR